MLGVEHDDLHMTKTESSVGSFTNEKRTKTSKKLNKFGLGTDGSKVAQAATKKEQLKAFWNYGKKKTEETDAKDKGKLMVKEDDEKTEAVSGETFWATVEMSGGLVIWAVLLMSYFGLNAFGKYRDL